MKLGTESIKNEKYPVTIRFDEDDLPELKGWKVGGKYTLTLKVEQTSMSKGDEYGEIGNSKEKPMTRASFKVLSVTPEGRTTSLPKTSAVKEAMKKRI